MSKRIGKIGIAFDKAFPWTRLLTAGLFALMSAGLSGNDAWMAVLLDVSANGFDDRYLVGVAMGFITVSFFSLLCGVALFIWYLFVPSKEVPGDA